MNRPLIVAVCAGLSIVLSATAAFPCHLPAHLRMLEDSLTAAQLSLVAHGGADHTQVPYHLEAATPCSGGQADIFDCERVDLLEVIALSQIGGGSGNDLWGWVDPLTGVEYALVGRSNGTAFLELSDPENPVYLGNLPTHASSSTWRDIKVYQDHAFIVADFAGSHGMQVFDLTQLRTVNNPPVTFSETAHYAGFDRAHNVAINTDIGHAYAVGSDTCSGGLHIIDITTPTAPIFGGCFSADGYTHDAQCLTYSGPDPDYAGRPICVASNEDTVTIVDVGNPASAFQISRTGYPGSAYTHQGWLTEDQRYFIHDDEIDELSFGHNTRTYVWDVSDLDNPNLNGFYEAAGSAIDHNQYVQSRFTFQANYRRGMRILAIDDPQTAGLTEVGYFDTYPTGDGLDFSGAWSTYPYLPSGVVLVSDINRGLFILRPRLVDFEVTGSCPGTVNLNLSGLTPGGKAVIAKASGTGSFVVPSGSCQGTLLDLSGNAGKLTIVTANGNGDATFSGTAPGAACGQVVQAIDIETCAVSSPIQLP